MTGLPGEPRPAGTASTGVRPDLMTFGKVMGGGFPAAAFGGRADVMARLAPAGPVYQAGTLSGNPVATAAGLATLRAATDEVYAHVDTAAAELSGARRRRARRPPACRIACSTPATCSRSSSPTDAVTDYDDARRPGHVGASRAFFHAMLEQGVYLPPSAFEAWFVSAAHDDAALDRIADALPAAARAAAAAEATA